MAGDRVMKYGMVVLLFGQLLASAYDKPLLWSRRRSTGIAGGRWQAKEDVGVLNRGKNHVDIHRITRHPTNTHRVVLMCKNLNYLIMKKGRLAGTKNPKTVKKYGKFELQSHRPGVVRIYNLRARKYIAINRMGKAYITKIKSDDTYFNQTVKHTNFQTYHSTYHYERVTQTAVRQWYLAIKKSGHLKRPSKTLSKHRSIEFMASDYNRYKQQLMNSR